MNVKIIKHKTDVTLVEYVTNSGTPERVWIPRDELSGNEVNKDVVRCGVKYGLPWSELLSDSVLAPNTAAALSFERTLRVNGIWTISDLTNNQDIANGLVRKVTTIIVANLIRAATQYYYGTRSRI